ncbi:ABC transporter substrate-binding protein [Thermodesulfobacteriota bacterium]
MYQKFEWEELLKKKRVNIMLSKKVFKKRYGFQAILICFLAVLVGVLVVPSTGIAASKPTTVAEIALYQGPDRENILIEGAKKEGQLTLYTANTWINNVVAKEFEKKYPFVKVSAWRSNSDKILKRVIEEYAARRFFVDAMDLAPGPALIFNREGILQEYYSPEIRYYGDEVKAKGKIGVYFLGHRGLNISLGFNTKLIPPAEAPKVYKDLLDPKWKGKMSIAGSAPGIRWIGNALEVMGRDFIEKLSRQDVRVHNMSGVALANMIVAGEVPLSPTIFDSNIFIAKRKGAPVEWRPLEPVVASVGLSGLTTKAPHPHAALLFLDYLHSKEGQKVVIQGGLSSPREDIVSLEKDFKKTYLEFKYKSLDEYEQNYTLWQSLLKRLFIRKR